METFFFISLGITFILILLLVYHFKQRLSNLEQKSDTMLDIVNNVVKEMGVIKVLASSRPAHPLSAFMDTQRPLNDTFSKMSMNNVEVNEVNINEEDVKEVQEIHLAEPVEMDSSDEEEESDDEEEDDNEYEQDEDDDEKVVVSDDEEEVEQEELLEEELEQEEESVEEVKVIQEVEEVLEDQSIVVNKLEAEEVEVLSEESSEDPMEEYKKLAPAALKALIISKGYATDVAKMKKPQLLQILEENL
jgi:outer membrane biosynthesis protein TonB